jgi:hypothetical protein
MAQATSGTEASGGKQGTMSAELRRCIDNCADCHRVCVKTVQTCLRMGGSHAAPDHIRLLIDCAQICATSADFMTRGSPLHHLTCGACAEVCRQCAESCRKLGGDEMLACAEICDRCADSCARMSADA